MPRKPTQSQGATKSPLIPSPSDFGLKSGSVADADRVNVDKQIDVEAKLLDLSADLQRLSTRELGQRFWIRWIAISTGVIVIALMVAIMAHLMHESFSYAEKENSIWRTFLFSSPSVGVAMIVAPILSITTITVAIFVGAFRRFDDSDVKSIGTGATGAVSSYFSGS